MYNVVDKRKILVEIDKEQLKKNAYTERLIVCFVKIVRFLKIIRKNIFDFNFLKNKFD